MYMTNYLKKLNLALLLLLLLALASPAFAAKESGDKSSSVAETVKLKSDSAEETEYVFVPPKVTMKESSQLKKAFEKRWFKRRALIEKGNLAGARQVISEIGEEMINNGIVNLPDFSSALIVEARDALKKGLKKRAIRLGEFATQLSPKMSRFYFDLSDIHFSNNNFVKGLNVYFQGFRVRSNNFMESVLFKTNMLIFLIKIIISFSMIFTVLLSLKYFKLFLHDISDAFPKSLKMTIVRLYAVVFYLLPFFLNIGIFWQFIYLIILAFIYCTKKEKYILYAIVAVLAVIPFLLNSIFGTYQFLNEPTVNHIYQANQGTWYQETEKNLKDMLRDARSYNAQLKDMRKDAPTLSKDEFKKPMDTSDILLSLGLINKKRGDYASAEKYYLKGLAKNPNSYEFNINLGNIYYSLYRTEEAEKRYNDALKINPDSGIVHYNLHKLFLRKRKDKLTDIERAEKEFKMAMELAPDVVQYYSEILKDSSQNFNRKVIDEQVNNDSYRVRYNKFISRKKDVASSLLPFKIKGIRVSHISFVAIILFSLMLFLQLLNKSYAFTTVCQKCGGPVCYRCQRTIKDNKLCSQCYYIIVKREGADPKSKITKMLQIKNYVANRVFTTRLISFFLLGAGHILKGLTIRGTVFLLLFLTCAVGLLFPDTSISDIYITGESKAFFTLGNYAIVTIFTLIYIIGIRDIFRSE